MSGARILIADDHELLRAGLISILTEAHPEWEIVAQAANGQQAIEKGEALKPDAAIIDLSMPEPNGLAVTERLTSPANRIKVLVLTVHATDPVARRVRRAGASAFLGKNEAPVRLVRVMENILAGKPFFSPDYLPSSIDAKTGSGKDGQERIPVQFLLTPRELAVLRLLARGCSNKEVAGNLDMSVRTAESHRANILLRLGVESLGELVNLAVLDGLG